MSTFEKVLLGLIAASSIEAPLFIKSGQSMAIFNASEEALLALLAALSAPKTPAA